MLAKAAPFLFVFLWSTGFLGAKYGLPHAAPLAFLLVRYGLVIALMAGVASLIAGMQPLLTATLAGRLPGETVLPRHWLGPALGFAGVALVVSRKLGSGFGLAALVPACVARVGIIVGTIYQKKFCPRCDWRSGAVAQFLPTALITGAIVFDSYRIDWTGEFVCALAGMALAVWGVYLSRR